MKTMIACELLTLRKMIPSQLFSGLLVGLVIGIFMQNPFAIVPAVSIAIPFGLAFTAFAFDERAGWERLRLALPLSRGDVIAGRYATFALIILCSIMLSLAVALALAGTSLALPDLEQLVPLREALNPAPLALSCALAAAISLLTFALIFPFVSKFGMTKSVRVISIFMVCAFVAFAVVATSVEGFLRPVLDQLLSSSSGIFLVSGTCVAIACALYALSCLASARLYATREF